MCLRIDVFLFFCLFTIKYFTMNNYNGYDFLVMVMENSFIDLSL